MSQPSLNPHQIRRYWTRYGGWGGIIYADIPLPFHLHLSFLKLSVFDKQTDGQADWMERREDSESEE